MTVLQSNIQTEVQNYDNVKNSTEDITKVHQTHSIRTDYKCNECTRNIIGCRYVCVQCAQYDVCAACEARGAHHHHYALRVPPHKHRHEAMAILERIRHIVNTELQEVPMDETESINSEVDTASDPPEAIVKMEMLDIGEYQFTPYINDHATIKQEAQAREDNKRQQRRKRRAPSPDTRADTPLFTLADTHTYIAHNQLALLTDTPPVTLADTQTHTAHNQLALLTDTPPVTLADTHTHVAHNQLALLTDTPPVTLADTHTGICHSQVSQLTSTKSKSKTKTLSRRYSVPSSSKTMPAQTPPSYEVSTITTSDVNAPMTFKQASCSLRSIIMCKFPKTEINDDLQSDQAHTTVTSSSLAQDVSFDPSQPAEEVDIKTELPD